MSVIELAIDTVTPLYTVILIPIAKAGYKKLMNIAMGGDIVHLHQILHLLGYRNTGYAGDCIRQLKEVVNYRLSLYPPAFFRRHTPGYQ